ncbi:membrane protein [Clostridium acetobutylicum]|nr:membrane protein [Clostridium acetobutylicum]
MIYFLCSFYGEAEGIISYYKLRKEAVHSSFQIFSSEDIKLIISGTGKINAACAVGYIGSLKSKLSKDIFVNVGICGSRSRTVGECVFINKIKDVDTNKEFYPDILLKHDFEEGNLQTFSIPVTTGQVDDVCDMEGSAFFQSASKFFQKHEIALIKIVSDNANNVNVSGELVRNLIKKSMEKINSYIENYKMIFHEKNFLSDVCAGNIEKIVSRLRLTESQSIQLKKAAVAYKIRNGKEFDFEGFLSLEVKIKNDGKKYFSNLIGSMWK